MKRLDQDCNPSIISVVDLFFPLQAFPDNAARREVESLPAVCINDGCTWKGTIKEYEVNIKGRLLMSVCSFFPLCMCNVRGNSGVFTFCWCWQWWWNSCQEIMPHNDSVKFAVLCEPTTYFQPVSLGKVACLWSGFQPAASGCYSAM